MTSLRLLLRPLRIPGFSVTNQRAVRLAACDNPPRVMIITGPNGCGKSTLLYGLRSTGGDGKTLYVGPHRASRKQNVRMRFLHQNRLEMSELLSGASLPGFEGINIPDHNRDAWNFDEASSYLKYSLCQRELDRQTAITQRFDSSGTVSQQEIPDVWQPLREMTENLLPHLHFVRIDVTNRDQVQCLWEVHGKGVRVDIDELSSGEKAVIQLFFPLLEHRIQDRLDVISGSAEAKPGTKIAVLMDEPELHLHPNLQGKVLDYIRALSLAEGIQFVLATHSPTIVEQASSDELYLLRPTELVGADENQLVRIATDDEKLAVLRDVFGGASNITAMRRVVVVEGRRGDDRARRPSDARLYGFLSDRFGQVTLVSGGGKVECQQLARHLTEILRTFAPALKAVALVDLDVAVDATADEHVISLPVSMIENLLLDPTTIWNALVTVHHKCALSSEEAVASALDAILDGLEKSEVSRRVKAAVRPQVFRLSDPVEEAEAQINTFVEHLRGELSNDRLLDLTRSSKEVVSAFKAAARRREHFDGKRVLDEFFKNHVHSTGMSKEIFVYECARQASKRQSVSAFVEAVFRTLGIVPPATQTAVAANEC